MGGLCCEAQRPRPNRRASFPPRVWLYSSLFLPRAACCLTLTARYCVSLVGFAFSLGQLSGDRGFDFLPLFSFLE